MQYINKISMHFKVRQCKHLKYCERWNNVLLPSFTDVIRYILYLPLSKFILLFFPNTLHFFTILYAYNAYNTIYIYNTIYNNTIYNIYNTIFIYNTICLQWKTNYKSFDVWYKYITVITETTYWTLKWHLLIGTLFLCV